MVRIVTDSGAHLSHELRERFKIEIVPLLVLFGTKSYRDEVDLSNEQFFHMLTHEKVHPTTSAPAPGDFIKVWRPLLDAGQEIVSLHLPSGLSATYSSALNAKAQLESEYGKDLPVTVVDSQWVSLAQGFQALEGAKVASAGGSRQEVVQTMLALDDRIALVFLLDTLEYLKRGGRIGKAQAWLGGLFRVKPLLEIANARIEPLERLRSRKAGMQRLIDLIGHPPTTAGPRQGTGPLHVGILHARAPQAAQFLEDEIRARFNVVELYTSEIGPTIAVHAGPEAVGVTFYRE